MLARITTLCIYTAVLSWWALGGDAQTTTATNCTGWAPSLGDGTCDFVNNNEGCEYDGGDCCECTCVGTSCGASSYFCADPSSGCIDSRIGEYPNCTDGWIGGIGDGHCDSDFSIDNNNEACGFDGGDCCECTCIDGSDDDSSCEDNVFFCIDPSASCYDPDAAAIKSTCKSERIGKIGNGFCDYDVSDDEQNNNNEDCGFDGGDCCECTCVDGPTDDCGDNGFHCLDPSSGCIDPRVAEYTDCVDGWVPYIGDGLCQYEINNEEACGFDGGDCCECTCVDGDDGSCGEDGFVCMDPSSPCYDPDTVAVYATCTDGPIERVGDGHCDYENNNKVCGFDGGDCCDCTCSTVVYACDPKLSFCLDPSAPCYDQEVAAIYSQCTDDLMKDVGDGTCDSGSNLEACRFDGGDCCACTCVGDNCGSSAFDCLDPSGAGAELYDCEEPPPDPLPCPANGQFEWVVENTVQALAVAEAVNCSSGSFIVEWRGSVVVNETIVVADGTALKVTGATSGSTIDGDGLTRLFTVINASLHLSNVNVSSGYAFYGGAIAASGSNLTFHRTAFIGNAASKNGGALLLMGKSIAFFTGATEFRDNAAGEGAALYASGRSSLSWEGTSTFWGNIANTAGGAICLLGGSVAWWKGDSEFLHNIADWQGGALYMTNASASWEGATVFCDNSAGSAGGALYMSGVDAFWAGNATFSNNTADSEGGGALRVMHDSVGLWAAEATFAGNIAQNYGGALYVSVGSSVAWKGKTTFSMNTANRGGALYAVDGSDGSWAGETTFNRNSAGQNGGGVLLREACSVSWNSTVLFLSNTATDEGGALYVTDASNVSALGEANFVRNSADVGGALLVSGGSKVELYGDTNFSSNVASSDGGAVGSELFSSSLGVASMVNDDESLFVVRGATIFENNLCGGNGGAMALLGMLSIYFETTKVTFSGNTAGVSGGAVFISSTGTGPEFTGTTFVSNSAQLGGGVYATGSGTAVTLEIISSSSQPIKVSHPTTFDGCSFVGNLAKATGGAVDSASGEDEFVHTTFENNSAGVGGALRLGGKASVDSCTFVDNVSDESGGPAVSNIGFISEVTYSHFSNNLYSCEAGAFLEFSQSGDLYSSVCDGCPSPCKDCTYDAPQSVPQCTTLDEAGVEHANSSGGVVTVEDLVIEEGYWRATATSTSVLECYNADACLGGMGSGSCADGYEGPYCAVCSEHYVGSLGLTCGKCSEAPGGIALAVIIALFGAFTAVAVLSYLLSGDMEGQGRGLVDQVLRRLPLHTIKIIIVSWQILTQFTSVANVTYPDIYERFLDGVDFLNFDLSWVLSVGCIIELDFHNRLLLITLAPIAVIVLLCCIYAMAVLRNSGCEVALRNVRHKHVSMALLVTFLVYSSVSSVVFQMFACEKLDDERVYLRADYSIECDDRKHKNLMIYAGIMIFVYPVGIPALYAHLLFTNRDVLHQKDSREDSFRVKSTSDLWKPYKPSRYYYEVIECGRRILLAGVVVFIFPNTAAQIAITLVIAVLFIFVSEGLAPYESLWDTWVSRIGHGVVFISMYLALLLKVDVSDDTLYSQKAFETILVCVHVCMVLAVITEAILIACVLRVDQLEDIGPSSRFTRLSSWFLKKDTSLVDFGGLSRVDPAGFPRERYST